MLRPEPANILLDWGDTINVNVINAMTTNG